MTRAEAVSDLELRAAYEEELRARSAELALGSTPCAECGGALPSPAQCLVLPAAPTEATGWVAFHAQPVPGGRVFLLCSDRCLQAARFHRWPVDASPVEEWDGEGVPASWTSPSGCAP